MNFALIINTDLVMGGDWSVHNQKSQAPNRRESGVINFLQPRLTLLGRNPADKSRINFPKTPKAKATIQQLNPLAARR